MKKLVLSAAALCLVLVLPSAAPAQTAGQKAKIDALLPALRKAAADAVVVKAVKAQNARNLSLDQIKKLDAQWMAASGVAAFMKPYLENECAEALRRAARATEAITEAFAMDNQGALVGATNKTSDYWQGDEDKWKKSFNGGKGGELVEKPTFDESSQSYVVQVSVPVLEAGKAIGAVTFALSLDRLH